MLAWMLLALMPLGQMDSPNWRIREAATVLAREHLSPLTAPILESFVPRSPEQKARIDRLLAEYWQPPGPADLPTFDMLYLGDSQGKMYNTPYWQSTLGSGLLECRRGFIQYRLATWYLVKDLYDRRVPKPLVNLLLRFMWEREKKWDAARRPNYHGSYPY